MFTAAPEMAAARFKLPGEAVQLASGRLLIAGGSKQSEIFDPNTRIFMLSQAIERALALHD
jgi:hypothetical protein